MKIGKATFDCTIGMPGFSNVKLGAVEIILEEGETIEDAWSELNRRALAWHRKEFPHLYSALHEVPFKSADIPKEQQDDNADDQFRHAVRELQKIQYKEDAEAFIATEIWMKYDKTLRSIVNAKSTKNETIR